jgi:thioredoxin reductase
MSGTTEIVVVGAGPYGLSIGAHLFAKGANFRIVGTTMQSWIDNMPNGMMLKSEGIHSSLYAPANSFTLKQFCKEHGKPYDDLTIRVPNDTFIAYCRAFERQFVPVTETRRLAALKQCPEGFELTMADGHSFKSKKVIIATGHDMHRHTPELFSNLPPELCTHSGDHRDMTRFKDKNVVIVGGGPSAIEVATLLHENQARVQLIARKPEVNNLPLKVPKRALLQRIRAPFSAIGPGWRGLRWSDAAWLTNHLVERVKLVIAKRVLKKCSGDDMLQRFAAVPQLLEHHILDAVESANQVLLTVADRSGKTRQIVADHVITATGYRPDVRRLAFLNADIINQLDLVGTCPKLSAHFESSVPGLYFVGLMSASSFGSLMRFVAGAKFTTQRILRVLVADQKQQDVIKVSPANSLK